jgi:hypothetical protein
LLQIIENAYEFCVIYLPVKFNYFFLDLYIRGVSESSWTVIVVTGCVKAEERGSQGHSAARILLVCHVTPCCEHFFFT